LEHVYINKFPIKSKFNKVESREPA